jgi:prevent-host-death family protein
MNTVSVKELKNRLAHYLRRTKQGEEIIVTDRGTPIALLHPINGTVKAVSLEGKLAGLAARGSVILPTQKPLKRVRLVKASGKPASKVILDERR